MKGTPKKCKSHAKHRKSKVKPRYRKKSNFVKKSKSKSRRKKSRRKKSRRRKSTTSLRSYKIQANNKLKDFRKTSNVLASDSYLKPFSRETSTKVDLLSALPHELIWTISKMVQRTAQISFRCNFKFVNSTTLKIYVKYPQWNWWGLDNGEESNYFATTLDTLSTEDQFTIFKTYYFIYIIKKLHEKFLYDEASKEVLPDFISSKLLFRRFIPQNDKKDEFTLNKNESYDMFSTPNFPIRNQTKKFTAYYTDGEEKSALGKIGTGYYIAEQILTFENFGPFISRPHLLVSSQWIRSKSSFDHQIYDLISSLQSINKERAYKLLNTYPKRLEIIKKILHEIFDKINEPTDSFDIWPGSYPYPYFNQNYFSRDIGDNIPIQLNFAEDTELDFIEYESGGLGLDFPLLTVVITDGLTENRLDLSSISTNFRDTFKENTSLLS